MQDAELLRYSRHILLDDIGIDGQQRLLDARALIIGAGGLGSPVALYLAAAGVGQITLIDDDRVDLTNLQRQIAHAESRVGQSKVASAAQAMRALNAGVQVRPLDQRADAGLLDVEVAAADVVLDCCDNFATRQAVNAACVRHRRPLVSGAAIRTDGQVAVYDPREPQSPCYACVFPSDAPPEETRCATLGVLAPLVGVIGSLQATEALLLLAGRQRPPGRLTMFDARLAEWSQMRLVRRADCAVCSAR